MTSNIEYLTNVLNAKCDMRNLEAGNMNVGYKGQKIPWTVFHVKNNRAFCYADNNDGDTHICSTCQFLLENKEIVYLKWFNTTYTEF